VTQRQKGRVEGKPGWHSVERRRRGGMRKGRGEQQQGKRDG